MMENGSSGAPSASTQRRWPQTLWIVRHGESAGNVARDAAQAAKAARIDIGLRDVDVPLSELGVRQATALGHWFAGMADGERPDVLLVSPYLRARQTAEALRIDAASVPALRECDYGSWAGLSFDEVAQENAAGAAEGLEMCFGDDAPQGLLDFFAGAAEGA